MKTGVAWVLGYVLCVGFRLIIIAVFIVLSTFLNFRFDTI